MSAFLTADDVARLTARKKFSAQRRKLDELGIRYTEAANGAPLVRPADLDASRAGARNRGPRWDKIAA